jgi:hypothetical protein
VLDVRSASQYLGWPEGVTRARIARKELPYRRLGRDGLGRIVLIKSELLAWLTALPGVTVEEAIARAKGEAR